MTEPTTETQPTRGPAGPDERAPEPGSVAEQAMALADEDPADDPPRAFGDLELGEDGMPEPEDLRNALRAVMDPEIGYNIVDLGLVYEVTKPEQGQVHVLMTLTSMGCPLTEVIHEQCSVILGAMPGVDSVDVEFTFSPPWDPSMMTDHVRDELRAMGMNV